jgi:hypothetical protein
MLKHTRKALLVALLLGSAFGGTTKTLAISEASAAVSASTADDSCREAPAPRPRAHHADPDGCVDLTAAPR